MSVSFTKCKGKKTEVGGRKSEVGVSEVGSRRTKMLGCWPQLNTLRCPSEFNGVKMLGCWDLGIAALHCKKQILIPDHAYHLA